ncbi:GGDEF domain-containing protein [Lachnospiraceae bacterium OttesenSCG-928-J05]|nr:GGDEF domain-containing protein [Lachnospiraceae bacterium OttesenSCG-928-J05]
MKLKNIQILSNAFFYIPLIYFFTGGYNGTAFLFSTLAAYMLAISYSGVKRVIMIALQMICYLGCIIISYLKPELVVPINSELSRVQDICITTAMAIGGMAIIATAVTRSFERKNDELSEVVLRDALTGAYNRRHLYENISEAINRDAQERQKSVVMMLDIDFFKKINDTYGHATGDDTLIAFNNTVRKTLREQDVLVRYGGEEFVAILFNTDHTAGTRIAERVREAVCNIEYPLGYKTTVSIGVAVMHKDDTLDTALVRADSYLYETKETGRNKVVSKISKGL